MLFVWPGTEEQDHAAHSTLGGAHDAGGDVQPDPHSRVQDNLANAAGARVKTISPGIVMTPLARDELTGPRGAGYRRMLELSPAGRAGIADEVAGVAALPLGSDGAFITGSDILMDGGVTASWFYGDLAPTE